MKEITDIIKEYDKLKNSTTGLALATVIDVEGSSYRRTGARMLIQDNGIYTGGISPPQDRPNGQNIFQPPFRHHSESPHF